MNRPLQTCAAMALCLLISTAAALAQSGDPKAYPTQTAYPKEDKAGVARHLSAARDIAGDDLAADMRWRCLISPLDRQYVAGVQHDGIVPAGKIYDNLSSIGQNAVSAYALETSDGIILIDALNTPEEARDIIVPNLKALGLDPARIKYVIVTHGHGDHYGGAKYLQDTYGAKVMASAADWEMMRKPAPNSPFAKLVPPRQDLVVKDGDTLTLGTTSVKLYVTPGHTPGTLSLIFPVSDKGVPLMAGLMGGTGGGQTPETIRQQINSLQRWRGLADAANVKVLITNHPAHMSATEKQVLLRYAMPGDANPFTTGKARYQRYMQIMEECSRVQLARMGEASD